MPNWIYNYRSMQCPNERNADINYIIVDDEPIAHRIIEDYSRNLPHLEKSANCYDALQAIHFLSTNSVDLIFLDLHMPKLKGFDFLKTLQNPPKIIVTTAYTEFAIEGYELNICDYLLKPFPFDRFLKAVNKAMTDKNPTVHSIPEAKEKTTEPLFLKGDKKHHQIKPDDILYIEAAGNYSKVYLYNKTIQTHQKISALEALLSAHRFLRVHKSFIVARDKISVLEGNVLKINHYTVPIGQSYMVRVKKQLGIL